MLPDRPAVSVIVPNYNKARTLAACLDAIYAQTYPAAEVVVVDDASTDASAEVARRYPCRLVQLPDNRGVSAARNIGVARSRGDVIFFVDSDIALAPDAIAEALCLLAADPKCALVQGVYDKEPLFDDGPVERYRTLCEHFWRRRATGVVPVTLFALSAVRRGVVAEVGGFREDLRDAEDIEFGTRLPPGWRVRMSDRVVGRHDDVDRLLPFLAEHCRRSRAFAALVRAGSRPRRLRALSAAALLCTAGALASLALAVLTWWALAAVPLFLAGFLVADRELFGFVGRERSGAFLAYFVALHFLLYATTLVGAAAALVHAAPSEPRRRYGLEPATAPADAGR